VLIGVFIRGYKSYRATKFIPISTPGKLVSVYIGQNGAGKSGILDALDKYFNGGTWCINSAYKSNTALPDDKTPFICPVFAISKNSPPATLPYVAKQQAERIDSLIREELRESNSSFLSPALRDFKIFLDVNEQQLESKLIIPLGRNDSEPQRTFLGPFENLQRIRSGLDVAADKPITDKLKNISKAIEKTYKYFYVPVEVDAELFTKLGQRQVQHLLDESLQLQVAKAIGNESIDKIHNELTKYMDDLNTHLSNYKYHGPQIKISTENLAERVFDHYFSSKSLHKESATGLTPLSSLSSGEKRQALIDSIKSFLLRKEDRKNNVIVAIDEPDASLHVSSCHDQFEKVASLSKTVVPHAQVLVTTHWYGFLPLCTNGDAHHISKTDDSVEISTIDLSSYRESIKDKIRTTDGKFPIDAALKGYNDLVQSIFSSLLSDTPYSWIICEGLSDKIYLDHIIGLSTEHKIRILPVGGYSDVIRIHDRLQTPMSEKDYRGSIKGTIICLIDTDDETPEFAKKEGTSRLFFKRLAREKGSSEVILADAWSNKSRSPTSIEDALDAAYFCSTLKSLSSETRANSTAAREILSRSAHNANAKYSHEALDYKISDQHLILDIFKTGEDKVNFASKYCEIAPPGNEDLKWAAQLRDLIC